MGTTVRIRTEDKEKLARLRAMVTLSSGKRVTQEELLGALIDRALSNREGFVTKALGPKLPLSDKDFTKVKGLISNWRVETNSQDVDWILYNSRSTKRRKK
ncbi:hypothetical protein E6H37_00455 [Candidatus Bathyarchaeota archaeon]|nr:MAG: hypothetical protein E6H37_00455 [Candidatus Bathyarchaeota archaeon]